MAYANISQFRTLTNIKKELISDTELPVFFKIADRLINKLISTPVVKERISGHINGTNKDFRTNHAPICDTNLKNVTVVDSCDTADFTESADGTADTVVGSLAQDGGSAIAMGKDATATTTITYLKTVTSVDGTGRRLRLTVYIKDTNELTLDNAMEIRIGSASDKYYSKSFRRGELKDGINEIDIDLLDMGSSGTPIITALVYIYIEFNVPAITDLITHADLVMDYWRLTDIDSPDTSDATVYYATTDDDSGFLEYGTSQTITSLQPTEGIITMTTAPTTTTAEAGIFADYSYVSEDMDWELINTAACYMAAHLCGFKISGNAPNYEAIADSFARRDLAGAPDEWLRLCYSILINAVGEGNTGIGFRRVETRDLT